MKGIFTIIDGKPFVFVKKKKYKLTNVSRIQILNAGSNVFETRHIWAVVPFTNREFWARGVDSPVLNSGQEVEIERIEKKKATVKRIL